RSGRRSGLPSARARRPGVSLPAAAPATAATLVVEAPNVCRETVPPGCTPDAPYAPRRRNWFSQLYFGNQFSSDMIHESDALGYTTRWNLVPKELFWSVRAATVRNMRSRNDA